MLNVPHRIHWPALLNPLLFTAALIAALSYQGEKLHLLSISCLSLLVWAGTLLWRRHALGITVPLSAVALTLLAFWGWLALSLVWNPVQGSGPVYFVWLSVFPIAFWLYTLSIPADRAWPLIFRIAQLAGAVLAVWALVQLLVLGTTPRSVFLDVNSHAAFLGLIALPVAAQFLNETGTGARRRWLSAALLLLLTLAIAITGSRGVMVSAVIALLPLVWLAWRHATRRALWQMLSLVAIGFVVGNLLAQGYTVSRMASVMDPVSAGESRYLIWRAAWKLVESSPWLGHGLGNFVHLYPDVRDPADSSAGYMAHNDYLQFWVEAGLPSVILLLLLYAACAWYFVRGSGESRRRIEAAGLFGGLLLVALHSFLNFNFYLAATLLVAGLWLGRLHELTVPATTRSVVFAPARFIRSSVYRLLVVLVLAVPAAWLVAVGSAYLAYQQGLAHASKGSFLAAHESFNLAERLFPEMDVAYFTHADLYRYMLRSLPAEKRADREALFRAAEESLADSEQLNRYRAQTYWVRGDLYASAPDLAGPDWSGRAETEYKKAIALNPRFFAARENYARLLIRLGRMKDAHAVVEAGLREWYPEHPALASYLSLAAGVRERQGDREGAGKLRELLARISAAERHRRGLTEAAPVLTVPVSAAPGG